MNIKFHLRQKKFTSLHNTVYNKMQICPLLKIVDVIMYSIGRIYKTIISN